MEKLMSDPKKFDPTNIATSFGSKFLPETFRSEDMKLMEQAKRNFINAVLRRESGSAISASEFESGDAQYFPQPGDTKAVLDQKKRNREVAISGLTAEGSKAMPKVQQGLLQQQSAPVLGPLNGNSVNKSEKPSWAL